MNAVLSLAFKISVGAAVPKTRGIRKEQRGLLYIRAGFQIVPAPRQTGYRVLTDRNRLLLLGPNFHFRSHATSSDLPPCPCCSQLF